MKPTTPKTTSTKRPLEFAGSTLIAAQADWILGSTPGGFCPASPGYFSLVIRPQMPILQMAQRVISRWLEMILCALVINLLLPSFPAVGDDNHQFERFALTSTGDVSRGKILFQDEQRTKCKVCHQVNGKGGKVGPDLSSIGGKFDRPHLIEALLQPSAQIVEGYRSSLILVDDGQTLTGIITKQDDSSLTVVDANGKAHTIDRERVERVAEQTVSIMPEGLEKSLNVREFTDLIAYLESLRPRGNFGAGSQIQGPISMPKGFQLETLATGLTGATAMEVLPDGRILICEQTGALRVMKDDVLLPQPALELPVNHEWERGLIGVTLDPDFQSNAWIYVCWTGRQPYPHHRISRFRMAGDRCMPDTEQVLLVGDDQTKMGGSVPAGHQGGALHFGPDGCLYVGIGEQTAGRPSQKLDTFLGKILRINPDGTIPADNPLLDKTSDKYNAIWAYGLRNPFTFAIRADDGLMLINDVGGKFEEINVGAAGNNYGWPTIPHGPANKTEFTDPVHWYPEASISGGDFLADEASWPEPYRGKYFFADFKHGWIHTIDLAEVRAGTNTARNRPAHPFASGLRRPVDLRFDPSGRLLVLLRNAWVIDGKFQPGTSSLLAIYPD